MSDATLYTHSFQRQFMGIRRIQRELGDQTQDPERVGEITAPLRSRKPQLSATRLATQPPCVAGESCTQVALGPSISTDRLWSTGSPLMKLG